MLRADAIYVLFEYGQCRTAWFGLSPLPPTYREERKTQLRRQAHLAQTQASTQVFQEPPQFIFLLHAHSAPGHQGWGRFPVELWEGKLM